MIKLKDNVRVPKTVIILAGVANAAEVLGIKLVTVTSGNDSVHMPDSKHYKDEALDFRTHDLGVGPVADALRLQFRDTVKARLGADFDVLLEDHGGPNEHLHVEWDDHKPVKKG